MKISHFGMVFTRRSRSMIIDLFTQHFVIIQDPRQSCKVAYPLFDVLFLTVCAIIGGAEGWEYIEDFGESHRNWFQDKGLFRQGIPVHDTIARVIAAIDLSHYQQCFLQWIKADTASTDSELICIDSKTLRRSYNRDDCKSAINMVSA